MFGQNDAATFIRNTKRGGSACWLSRAESILDGLAMPGLRHALVGRDKELSALVISRRGV